MKKKISVIIPVYNSNETLKKTVSSILNQKHDEIEVLLINDGSTSKKTDVILRELTNTNSSVKLYNKKNEGIEKTRLFGVNKSTGDFIMFSDHDDWYLPDSIKKMYDAIIESSADIVVGNYYEILSRAIPFKIKGYVAHDNLVSHDEFIQKFYVNFFGRNIFNVSTWGKLYKRELFNDEIVTLGYNTTEDVAFNIQIFPKAQKVKFINDFLYCHVRGGLTSKINLDILLPNYESLYYLKEQYIEKYQFTQAVPFINYELRNIVYFFILKAFEKKYTKEEIIVKLEKFKATQAYNKLKQFYNNQVDNFMKYMMNDDYDNLLNLVYTDFKKPTLKKLLKKVF